MRVEATTEVEARVEVELVEVARGQGLEARGERLVAMDTRERSVRRVAEKLGAARAADEKAPEAVTVVGGEQGQVARAAAAVAIVETVGVSVRGAWVREGTPVAVLWVAASAADVTAVAAAGRMVAAMAVEGWPAAASAGAVGLHQAAKGGRVAAAWLEAALVAATEEAVREAAGRAKVDGGGEAWEGMWAVGREAETVAVRVVAQGAARVGARAVATGVGRVVAVRAVARAAARVAAETVAAARVAARVASAKEVATAASTAAATRAATTAVAVRAAAAGAPTRADTAAARGAAARAAVGARSFVGASAWR